MELSLGPRGKAMGIPASDHLHAGGTWDLERRGEGFGSGVDFSPPSFLAAGSRGVSEYQPYQWAEELLLEQKANMDRTARMLTAGATQPTAE